ncbi:MAG: ABC transporter substrate-binding protein [Acidimicrobiales bacterium]
MKMFRRLTGGVTAAAAAALLLAACGSGGSTTTTTAKPSGGSSTTSGASSTTATTTAGGGSGGTATVDMGTAPDSLDPQDGYTTQAAEADWITYTPLLTYAHKSGEAGAQVIPGLAKALPVVTNNGLTYTLTLRSGLEFSNGTPVKASDFAYSIERMLKVNWGGDSFITNYVKGAAAYLAGKATSISGITTDDATGKITIQLTTPYGAFDNVLAFPAAALVPSGSPMKNEPSNPPPGVGAYIIKNIVPNQSFELVKNPMFASFNIPGIPVGHLSTIKVSITSNTLTEAEQVLSNQVDNFDAGDTIPPTLYQKILSTASNRFAKEVDPSTFYFFLNTQIPPFNNQLAREAVNYAIDRPALQRLASGFLKPECYFLPPGLPGHSDAPCPYGSLTGGNIAKAKALLQQAHLVGAPVTVWGEERSPRKQYVEYYQGLLNQIGFKASLKIINDSTYFPTIGNAKTKAQTGFADWFQDFPNPSDFYLLLDAKSIQPVNNQNFSNVNDPHIQAALAQLDAVPATQLSSIKSDWQALDKYVAQKAYVVVYGTEELPKFMSTRIDFKTAVFSPLYLNDWSTWQLNK